MKGLVSIPQQKHLVEVYRRLQSRPQTISCDELALWSMWTRFDARLAEQLIEFFARAWLGISPLDLRKSLISQPWASALGVLLEHALLIVKKEQRKIFKSWMALVMHGIDPASSQSFLIGVYPFASQSLRRES